MTVKDRESATVHHRLPVRALVAMEVTEVMCVPSHVRLSVCLSAKKISESSVRIVVIYSRKNDYVLGQIDEHLKRCWIIFSESL